MIAATTDQVHFIHDFQAFSGFMPNTNLALATVHLNHVALVRAADWSNSYNQHPQVYATMVSEQEKKQFMANVKPIPDGYHSVQPYLMFKGCADAIAFYEKAFGAKEKFRMPDKQGRITHAEIEIGDSCIMMADEAPQIDAFSAEHYGGSPASLLIYTENCDAMYKQAVATGAKTLREPADQPYGDRMAGVKDPFGYKWWIATHIKDVSIQEMQKQQ